jgi:hypothetical protein
MDRKKFQELGKICSSNSILVINNIGIFRLFTPFKATCIISVETYEIGQEVTVIAVKMSIDYKLVYIIKNKGYYHHYFVITSQARGTLKTFN